MKKLMQFIAALGAVTLAHSVLLFGIALFTLMCTFGAPQGGDVPRTKEEVARGEAVKPFLHAAGWIGEKVVVVLKFPMATFKEPLPAFSGAWWLNSFLWGFGVVGVWTVVSSIRKKPNQQPPAGGMAHP